MFFLSFVPFYEISFTRNSIKLYFRHITLISLIMPKCYVVLITSWCKEFLHLKFDCAYSCILWLCTRVFGAFAWTILRGTPFTCFFIKTNRTNMNFRRLHFVYNDSAVGYTTAFQAVTQSNLCNNEYIHFRRLFLKIEWKIKCSQIRYRHTVLLLPATAYTCAEPAAHGCT